MNHHCRIFRIHLQATPSHETFQFSIFPILASFLHSATLVHALLPLVLPENLFGTKSQKIL